MIYGCNFFLVLYGKKSSNELKWKKQHVVVSRLVTHLVHACMRKIKRKERNRVTTRIIDERE